MSERLPPLGNKSSINAPLPPSANEGGSHSSANPTVTVAALYRKTLRPEDFESAKTSKIIQLKGEQADKLKELRNEYNRTGYHLSNAFGIVDWVKHMWNSWKVERQYTSLIQAAKNAQQGSRQRTDSGEVEALAPGDEIEPDDPNQRPH